MLLEEEGELDMEEQVIGLVQGEEEMMLISQMKALQTLGIQGVEYLILERVLDQTAIMDLVTVVMKLSVPLMVVLEEAQDGLVKEMTERIRVGVVNQEQVIGLVGFLKMEFMRMVDLEEVVGLVVLEMLVEVAVEL